VETGIVKPSAIATHLVNVSALLLIIRYSMNEVFAWLGTLASAYLKVSLR
jgi:hypothetical protein